VVPALAVAGALRAEGARVAFVGGDRAEAELVPAAGFELSRIAVEGMSRTNPLRAARALWRAGMAFLKARSMLRELRPDAVMGGGGYVAGPVGLAAVTLRIPLVVTEADSHLGITNRVLARGARRVCLAFPLAGRDGERYRVTGRPVGPAQADRAEARGRFGLAEGRDCVLVFGGSLGARSINLAAIEAFAGAISADATVAPSKLPDGAGTPAVARSGATAPATATSGATPGASAIGATFDVLHVAGRRDYAELVARGASREGYDLREYLDQDEFGDALAAADLVVARAGGSVWEIAASGTPAILVPYPHAAGDHQTENARWMERAGAAVVIGDSELDAGRLAKEVGELLGDRARLAGMAAASHGLARPDAAREIAGELLAAAGA
ncbi:MAG: UDP-N-acetylglucosamine--N-acetylmuramyl-(pentapeptide) pyrophosphoryl-undecaprenol N-acetylglucosamine transferase, partial [Solirubrobacteraceae bacterium]